MGFSDFCNHSVFSETSEDILRYEGVHVFSEDECSKKYQTEVTEMKKIMLLLSKVTLHYGNSSRSLEREQHLWLYGISAGCPGISLSMTEIHMKGKMAILLQGYIS